MSFSDIVCLPSAARNVPWLQLRDKGAERRALLNAEASKNRKQQPQEYRGQITKPAQLSKQTAGEINALHNTVTAQKQIKATETITEAPEGHRCALEWKWKSSDGRMHSVRLRGQVPPSFAGLIPFASAT